MTFKADFGLTKQSPLKMELLHETMKVDKDMLQELFRT